MKKKFIVIIDAEGIAEYRHVTQAVDHKTCMQEATRNCAKYKGKVVKIVPLTEEHELLYAIICEKLNMWRNIRKLEQVTGQDFDNFGDWANGVCAGLDTPPSLVEHEMYLTLLEDAKAKA